MLSLACTQRKHHPSKRASALARTQNMPTFYSYADALVGRCAPLWRARSSTASGRPRSSGVVVVVVVTVVFTCV